MNELRWIFHALEQQAAFVEASHELLTQLARQRRLTDPRYADPRHLNRYEQQIFSQHGEDGILLELLRRLHLTQGLAVEIGAGEACENSTAVLVALGWRAVWIEGDPARARALADQVGERVTIVGQPATAENVVPIVRQATGGATIDVLSVDIDLYTAPVWAALATLHPTIAIIEYNAAWPPSIDWTMPPGYDAWDGTLAFGASLHAMAEIGERQGYALVACDLSGTNAFFVRRDRIDGQFVGPFTAEACYQPTIWPGHRPAGRNRKSLRLLMG